MTRQLFKVKKQSVTTPEKEPSLDNLVDAFYSSAPDACAFWYTDMPNPPNTHLKQTSTLREALMLRRQRQYH